MKRILIVAGLALAASASAAYAAAPEAVGDAVAGCCEFLGALMQACCPC